MVTMDHAIKNPRISAMLERLHALCDDPEYQAQQDRIRREFAASDEREAEARRSVALQHAGIPASFWGLLAAPKETEALAAVREFVRSPPECVFLTLAGAKGRGKTTAACWGVWNLVAEDAQGNEHPRPGRYVWASDLVAAGAFDPLWGDLETEPILAIDELGAEYLNDAYLSSLYALLDKRFASRRKTILVTNLDGPSLRQRYGAGGLERLLERLRTGGRFVGIDGESMRRNWAEAVPVPFNEKAERE